VDATGPDYAFRAVLSCIARTSRAFNAWIRRRALEAVNTLQGVSLDLIAKVLSQEVCTAVHSFAVVRIARSHVAQHIKPQSADTCSQTYLQ
jgi:Tfp pilus assembly protein PilN